MNDATWFWQIVDARGLADVSSDEFVALNELISKAERATTAESERDELLREKERLEAALVYGVNCLCSVRKNYEEPELGLWEDVTRAISQGNAALAPIGEAGHG